jgi:hypothetical protein
MDEAPSGAEILSAPEALVSILVVGLPATMTHIKLAAVVDCSWKVPECR